MEITDKYAKILINKSDKRIPDPVFTDLSKKSRRKANKLIDEGQDFSAHVIVRFHDDPTFPALMLLEQCPGISVGVVEALLNRMLRAARLLSPADFVQVHPDGSVDATGKPKRYRVAHSLNAEGHPSDTFTADLNGGQVQAVQLTTRKRRGGFDTTGYFVEDKEIVVLKPTISIKRPQNLAAHVFSVVTGKKKDYTSARIQFKLASGEKRDVPLDLDEEAPTEYVRRETIKNFSSDLESSYDALHSEIVGRMMLLASKAM
jgi:hypothetical protein